MSIKAVVHLGCVVCRDEVKQNLRCFQREVSEAQHDKGESQVQLAHAMILTCLLSSHAKSKLVPAAHCSG